MAVSLQCDYSMANQSSNTAPATSKPRILSVCNDGSVLRTRGMVLQNAGYNVYSAEDCGQAVNECAASRFDVAVLSASLPYDDRIRSEERRVGKECRSRW